jgi:hypothetical protein
LDGSPASAAVHGEGWNHVDDGLHETSPAYAGNQDLDRDLSRIASAQRAILALTEILEDSAELFGATLREEAARIPGRFVHPAAGFLADTVGASLLTAAAALYLRDFFGGWHLSFLSLGGLYVLVAVLVWNWGSARK